MGQSPRTAVLTVAIALIATGCGGTSSGTGDAGTELERATLVLDYLPNAVHAGIYRAQAAGYYRDSGLKLRIIRPTSTADTLKLIDAGRADFGLADTVDVLGQIDSGRDAQALMAIVQRPLGGVITRRADRIASPRRLEGRLVGVTGVPSDGAILDTVVADAGGDPDRVRRVTIGFGGVQALIAGKVDAFVGYYPADGVQATVDGTPTTAFRFDEHGGPRYPGLVAFSTRGRIARSERLMRAFIEATVRGYEDALADPDRALDDLLSANPALDRRLAAAQLAAYRPLFADRSGRYGVIRDGDIGRLSRFLVERKLIGGPVSPDRFAGPVALTDR